MKYFVIALAVSTLLFTPIPGEDEIRADKERKSPKKPSKKLSFVLRGAHCDMDLKVMRKSLGAVKGIKFNTDDLQAGGRPRYFTSPFLIEMQAGGDNSIDIGRLASGLAKAKTPHRKTSPPKVNLILFTKRAITEESVMALRAALRNVNGLEVDAPGGLGGMPRQEFYWVQLEPAGGAALKDVLDALEKQRIDLTVEKP